MADDDGDMVERLVRRADAAEAERDRLRAVVEQALNLGETEAMARGKEPYPEWWIVLDRALDPRERQLGGSEATDG